MLQDILHKLLVLEPVIALNELGWVRNWEKNQCLIFEAKLKALLRTSKS